jgi:hypothetical protein
MALRAGLVWLLCLSLAVANGLFRAAVLVPRLGEMRGYAASTILLAALILGVTALTIRWINPATSRQAWAIGVGWTAATLAFEILAGRLSGRSWPRLWQDYDLTSGRIWPLVLFATLFAPVWANARRGAARRAA